MGSAQEDDSLQNLVSLGMGLLFLVVGISIIWNSCDWRSGKFWIGILYVLAFDFLLVLKGIYVYQRLPEALKKGERISLKWLIGSLLLVCLIFILFVWIFQRLAL